MTDLDVRPENIALIVVDVSPLWLCGHTCLVANPDLDQKAEAVVTQRISDVMALYHDREGGEHHWPTPIAVESQALAHLRIRGLAGKVLGLMGVYGDLCVLEVALALQRRGWPVVIIEDACLWTSPLDQLLDPTLDVFKMALTEIPRARANTLWPEVTGGAYWRHEPPAYNGPDYHYPRMIR